LGKKKRGDTNKGCGPVWEIGGGTSQYYKGKGTAGISESASFKHSQRGRIETTMMPKCEKRKAAREKGLCWLVGGFAGIETRASAHMSKNTLPRP